MDERVQTRLRRLDYPSEAHLFLSFFFPSVSLSLFLLTFFYPSFVSWPFASLRKPNESRVNYTTRELREYISLLYSAVPPGQVQLSAGTKTSCARILLRIKRNKISANQVLFHLLSSLQWGLLKLRVQRTNRNYLPIAERWMYIPYICKRGEKIIVFRFLPDSSETGDFLFSRQQVVVEFWFSLTCNKRREHTISNEFVNINR